MISVVLNKTVIAYQSRTGDLRSSRNRWQRVSVWCVYVTGRFACGYICASIHSNTVYWFVAYKVWSRSLSYYCIWHKIVLYLTQIAKSIFGLAAWYMNALNYNLSFFFYKTLFVTVDKSVNTLQKHTSFCFTAACKESSLQVVRVLSGRSLL